MSEHHVPASLPIFSRVIMTIAGLVIVIAGMRAAATILVPFLLAAVLAIMFSPFLLWLQQKGLPRGLALLLIMLVIVVLGGLLTTFIGSSFTQLALTLPAYEERLAAQQQALIRTLEDLGVDTSEFALSNLFNAERLVQTITGVMTAFGSVLTNSLLILFTVIFMLLEASSFPAKLRAAFGTNSVALAQFHTFSLSIKEYVIIKSWVSLFTGVMVTLWLLMAGIDFPFLWGAIAFLFNYIPNIGSLVAAVPAVVLGLVQHGIESAILVCIGYMLVNFVVGYIIEPRFMGRGLGLSTLVVFVALVFWGWVLGPVGLLLSMPLTVLIKVILESNEQTRWLGLLMSSEHTVIDEQAHRASREMPLDVEQAEQSIGSGRSML